MAAEPAKARVPSAATGPGRGGEKGMPPSGRDLDRSSAPAPGSNTLNSVLSSRATCNFMTRVAQCPETALSVRHHMLAIRTRIGY
ncbi:hypothetical protein AB0B79_09755 [Streptomyces sp. NPDC039022]|uniref:hypothetical protein n=1 Tax=unclassified Streptomyces TaxID=2593676 RepID=UPI0033EA5131